MLNVINVLLNFNLKNCGKLNFERAFVLLLFLFLQSTITYEQDSTSPKDSSKTWVVFPADTRELSIDQLYLYHGAHLAFDPLMGSVSFTTNVLSGDFVQNPENLGTIYVGPQQTVTIR